MAQKRHYFDNATFLCDYRNWMVVTDPTKKNRFREKLFTQLLTIVDNLIFHNNFSRHDAQTKADMKSYAREVLTHKLQSFDIEKYDNPFAYFTRVVFNAFTREQGNFYRRRALVIPLDRIDNLGDLA